MSDYKRLTKKFENGYVMADCTNCPSCNKCDDITHYCQRTIKERLAELEDKIENGTLIELPCKKGDKVYMPWEYNGVSAVAELTVDDIFLDANIGSSSIKTNLESDIAEYMRRYSYGLFKFEDIGQKIFLTKAEAEAKLKGLKGEENG